MPDSNQKGDRNERELVNHLDAHGYAVMRAPASGSATERELPDVLAGDGDSFYAIEGKSGSGTLLYFYEEEVEDLVFFAKCFGATPLLGARFDEEYGDPSWGEDWPGWYFAHPENAYRTDGGNYRLKKTEAFKDAIRLIDL